MGNKTQKLTFRKQRFNCHYFLRDKVYCKTYFKMRLRMNRVLYARLEAGFNDNDNLIIIEDATGKNGSYPRIKLIVALNCMECGMEFEQIDEICEISESATRKVFISFSDGLN